MSCDPRIQQAIDLLNGVVKDCAADPMPTPAPSPDVLASSVPLIPSNFDVASHIGGTVGTNIPISAAPDVLGAFRMTGNVSHYSYDDPIVYPDQPGKSHLHEYIGNRSIDNTTTYAAQRALGEGTTEGGPVNRSGYWSPALILGGDVIAVPDCRTIYYKRHPRGSASIPAGVTVARLPRGLRMISHEVSFMAMRAGKLLNGQGYHSAFDFAAQLQPGDQVHTSIVFPNRWDGKRVDSADHMSHVGFPTSGLPFEIAQIHLFASYTVQTGDDWANALYSSDKMMGKPLGTTYHGDYAEGWDDATFDAIEANALDKMLNCSGGEIGDGRQLKRPPTFSFSQTPKRIPLSDVPLTGQYVMP